MKLENKKKLTQLIRKREEIAQELKEAYEQDIRSAIRIEIKLDKISWQIKKLTLPPVKTKYMEYDNS